MISEDFHIHSNLTDGKDNLEDIVRAAIDLKMTKIGFSEHIYTDFDESYCMSISTTEKYKNEVNFLKEKYKDKISIYLGIETDYYSSYPTDDFDYVIGSVHYIYKNDKYFEIDLDKDNMAEFVNKTYDNDYFLFAKDYYNCVSDIIFKTNADIIGHFDLITKFNENNCLFDMRDDKYLDIAKKAVDRLILFNKPFEVNTGAISRGYRNFAYPDLPLLEYIHSRGGKIILSSDSHSKDTLCNKFDEYEKLIKEIGFKDYMLKI